MKKRNFTILIMVSESEKEKIKEAAERGGMTVSSYARIVLLREAKVNDGN